jgi:hypothetical protein
MEYWSDGFKGVFGNLNCETFEKCFILFKYKESENFNHRNTLSISRIKKLTTGETGSMKKTPKRNQENNNGTKRGTCRQSHQRDRGQVY